MLTIVTLLPSLYLLATSFTPLNLTNPETQWDFSHPLVNYAAASRRRPFRQLGVGASKAVVLDGDAAGAARHRRRAAAERGAPVLAALRTVFLIPMVLPPIVVAMIWKVIYTPDISPMHQALKAIGWNVPALITDPNFALTAIIIADTWEWFPFTMLMVLAALQTLPEELLDAASVDGARWWQPRAMRSRCPTSAARCWSPGCSA